MAQTAAQKKAAEKARLAALAKQEAQNAARVAALNAKPTPAYSPAPAPAPVVTAPTPTVSNTPKFDAIQAAADARVLADKKLKDETEPKTPAPAGTYYQWHVFAGGGGEWRTIRIPGWVDPAIAANAAAQAAANEVAAQAAANAAATEAAATAAANAAANGASETGIATASASVITSQNTTNVPQPTIPITPVAPITSKDTVADLPGVVEKVNKNDPGAMQIITDSLNAAGLGALASNAWAMWNKGLDINAIMDDPVNGIRASAVYKARYPAMKTLIEKGEAISEMDYLAKEKADRGMLYQYLGDSAKSYDNPESLGKIIAGRKSTAELQSDLQNAHDSVLSADPYTIQALKDQYGLTQQELTAFWLNPDMASVEIERRSRAGILGGVALRTGAGGITKDQAESLYAQGTSQAQAEQGFTAIGLEGQFKTKLPGDAAEVLTQQDLIDAHFGGKAEAIAKVGRVRQNRVSQFQAGGEFASDQRGVSGLGTSNTR